MSELATQKKLTAQQEAAIHASVNIDGLTFKQAGRFFDVPPEQAEEIFDRLCHDNENRFSCKTDSVRIVQHDRLDDMYRLARRDYSRSKRSKVSRTDRLDATGRTVGSEVKTEERDGDTSFLRVAISATDGISDLHGTKAPKSMHVNTHSIHEMRIRLDSMTDEQLEKVSAVFQLEQQGLILIDGGLGPQAQQPTSNETPLVEDRLEVALPIPVVLETSP